MQPRLRIFISYAREDDDIKSLFIREFRPTAEGRLWQIWDDSKILVGDAWDSQIKTNLESADVVVFFYSSDFMNSSYIGNVEFKQALEKYERGDCLLITFRITSTRIDKTNPLRNFQYVDLYSPDNPPLLKRMNNLTLQNAATENQQRDVVNFGINEIMPALEAFEKRISGDAGVAGPIPDSVASLDPNALVVSIQQNEQVLVVPPQATQSKRHKLDKKGLPRKAIQIFQRLLVKGDLEDEDCQVLGEALFYLLFPTPDAQNAFLELYRKHGPSEGSSPLKIILHFDQGSDALAGLPWEYLWLPLPEGEREGFFIGSKNNWVLTRRLHTTADKGKEVAVKKLRILVVISKPPQPEEARGIDDDADFIIKKCQASKDWDKDKIDIVPKSIVASKAEFTDLIQQNEAFHIVHFIGKGKTELARKDAAESSSIAFCDPVTGKEEWLTPEEFVACFDTPAGSKRPNLLFLHAIRDTPDACVSLRKAALELVNSVDGVLAIQTPVNSEEAAEFSEGLYNALGRGADLDVAIADAARRMAEHKVKRLRMYGISASFSRQTLKMEIARPVSPIQASELTFLRCPKYDDPGRKCTGIVGVENGRPTRLRCPECKSGPVWVCPGCNSLVELSHDEESCPRCDYPMAQIMQGVPSNVLDIIPAKTVAGTRDNRQPTSKPDASYSDAQAPAHPNDPHS